MIYIDTRRAFWSRRLVFTKFFGTTLLLGAAGAAVVLAWTGIITGAPLAESGRAFAIVALLIRTALFAWELNNFRARTNPAHPHHPSALIMWTLRRPLVIARWVLFFVSTLLGVVAIARADALGATCATLSFLATAASQVIERYFFFTAVVAPRMPGPLVPQPSKPA
jgi:DMSO reductase anchor subunit